MSTSDPAILDGFWKLTENKDNVRVEAAVKILGQVKSSPDATFYAASRLVRGLGSPRDSARKGFFTAFVELLKQADQQGMTQLLAKIEATLKDNVLANKSGSKGEEGDALVGQMLTRGAMLRSGRVDGPEAEKCVRELLEVAGQRMYLRVPAYMFIVDAINAESLTEEQFKKSIWPALRVGHDWKVDCPSLEAFWVLLAVREKFPSSLDKQFMLQSFGRKKLFTEEFLTTIVRSKEEAYATIQLHALRRHPVFPLVLKALKEEGLMAKFWSAHLEPSMVKGNGSKAILGFALLDAILGMIKAKDSKAILGYMQSVNVRETALFLLSRIEASPEEEALIYSVLAKVSAAAKENKDLQTPVLKALLTYPGNIAFDKVTGGNVVHQLVSFSGSDAVRQVGTLYRRAVQGQPDGGQARSATERVYAAHQLAKLVAHPALAGEEHSEWRIETMNFLLAASLFDIRKEIAPFTSVPVPFARESRADIKDVFFKALDLKTKNFESMCVSLRHVAAFADKLLLKHELVKPLNSDAKKAWKQMLKDAEDAGNSDKKEDKVFQLLFLHMGFQLFSDAPMALETLADLRECHERSRKSKPKNKRKSLESEPLWVEVVVDLLLSLLSQNKHVLRQLVNSVFAMITPHLTAEALKSIMDVIKPSEEDDEEKEDGDSDDEYETEEEMEVEEGDEDKDDDEDEDDDDSGDEMDDEEYNKTMDDEFVAKLKKAMNEHEGSDDESINMDDIPEEDMNKMDEALAQVFKTLSGKKSSAEKKKEAKDQLAHMHFKIRALDMIDVYLTHMPLLSHVLIVIEFVLGALQAINGKKEMKPLQDRLKNTLKKVTNLKKPTAIRTEGDEEFSEDALVELLQTLIDLANTGSPLMALLSQPLPLFAQTCTLLLKFGQQVGGKNLVKKIYSVYSQALDDFFTKTHCLLPLHFFQQPMQSNWQGSWLLAPKLVESGFNPKTRQFRRTHALALLGSLFHNQNLQEGAPADVRDKVSKDIEINFVSELERYDGGGDIKPRFLCELFNIMHGLHISKATVDWTKVSVSLEAFREKVPKNRHFQDVKKAFNKIGALLKVKVVTGSEKRKRNRTDSVGSNGEPAVKAKPANKGANGFSSTTNGEEKKEATNGAAAPEGKKKKKGKGTKEGKQSRKQQKQFALNDQFEGMEMPSFSGLALSGNMNFELAKTAAAEPATAKQKKAKKFNKNAVEEETNPQSEKKKKKKKKAAAV